MTTTQETGPAAGKVPESRVQLALNVSDLDAAIGFYSELFQTEPHKRREGYANFEVADPPLKLVLIEQAGGQSLNHIGVEVFSTDRVIAETRRLGAAGLETRVEDGVVCCHAEQDKVWVSDPDGLAWEVYTVTDDEPALIELVPTSGVPGDCDDPACCA